MLTNETLYTMVACQTYKNQALNLRFPEIIRTGVAVNTQRCLSIHRRFYGNTFVFWGPHKTLLHFMVEQLELVVPKIPAKEGEPPPFGGA